jgi:hypothetical protein
MMGADQLLGLMIPELKICLLGMVKGLYSQL